MQEETWLKALWCEWHAADTTKNTGALSTGALAKDVTFLLCAKQWRPDKGSNTSCSNHLSLVSGCAKRRDEYHCRERYGSWAHKCYQNRASYPFRDIVLEVLLCKPSKAKPMFSSPIVQSLLQPDEFESCKKTSQAAETHIIFGVVGITQAEH
eukprot:1160135-Pelagomonas_calceolata.AAC.3